MKDELYGSGSITSQIGIVDKKQTDLDDMINRVMHMTKHASAIYKQLAQTVTRIYGPFPEEAMQIMNTPTNNVSTLDTLRQGLAELSVLQTKIDDMAQRLGNL